MDEFHNGIHLIFKNFYKNQKTQIFSDSNKKNLSEKIWSMDSYFIPNLINPISHDASKSVLESVALSNDFNSSFDELLINASSLECPYFSRFVNLIEIVTMNEKVKVGARLRLQNYRDSGYEIDFIDYKELAN